VQSQRQNVLHAEGLKGLLIFLVVAGVIVPLFHRARISTVIGFLVAGVALGPHGLGRLAAEYPWVHYVTFDRSQRGEALAEFGIIMLLFLLGLELSFQRLWQLRRYVFGVGLAQVAISTLAIGVAVRLSGGVPPSGIILGLCLALSSTAIVMQILAEQHRVAHPVGRIALSVLLFQDMMVAPILFIIGMLGGAGARAASGDILQLITPFATALGAVLAIMLVGRFVMRPLLNFVMRTGARDLIMAIALLILTVAAVVTGLAGMSAALGAFLAGLLFSDSEGRHQIEVDLEPFKGLLLGIFFIAVGANLDLAAVAGDVELIIAAVVGLIAIKAVVLFMVARAFGIGRTDAIEVALLLAQTGEFAFVVIGTAQASNLLSGQLAADAVAVVSLSMLLTPLLAGLARKLAARLSAVEQESAAPAIHVADLDGHVVIGGFGRVGEMMAEALEAENVPYVALDRDADRVQNPRHKGRPVFFGDATRAELLERVNAGRARAFVVTIDNRDAAERMVTAARHVNAGALIFARAADASHAARLMRRGAFGVIPEAAEAGVQLAGRVLEGLDLPDDAVAERMQKMRNDELMRLDEAEAQLWDSPRPKHT
jgi:CPA2 family monovalent cation:H+ antiporter-2